MSSLDEFGKQVLDRLVEAWHIDSGIRWIEGGRDEPPGFHWWPGDFRVSVRINRREEAAAHRDLKVTVRTDYLKDVPTESDRFAEWAAATALENSTYAWHYFPRGIFSAEMAGSERAAGLVWLGSSAYVSRDTIGWMPELLAGTALLQPINAQHQAGIMTEVIGSGEPDTSRPADLRHLAFDDILETVADHYAPLGKGPSHWSGTDELKMIAEKWGRSDDLSDVGDPAGVSLEIPLGGVSAHIQLLTVEVHPQLGHGLMASLQLPYFDTFPYIANEAAALNLLEFGSWTGFPQLGCWRASKMRQPGISGLAFTLFMSNALYRPGLATHIAAWLLRRALWAYEVRYPDIQDLAILDLKQRVGRFSEQIDRPGTLA
jgi:hypothetical protein